MLNKKLKQKLNLNLNLFYQLNKMSILHNLCELMFQNLLHKKMNSKKIILKKLNLNPKLYFLQDQLLNQNNNKIPKMIVMIMIVVLMNQSIINLPLPNKRK